MESNTDLKNFFSGIIANPADVSAEHAPQLKTLVELYPQSGVLRALLARSSQVYDQGGFQQKLKSAAVYSPDRAVLYNLINYPEKLLKYVEPVSEVYEEEETVISPFGDDYSSYQATHESNAYTEETVYEETPINYLHEPEAFQQPEDTYQPYQPIPIIETEPVEEIVDFYNYTTPAPEYIEPTPEYAPSVPEYIPLAPEPIIEQQYQPPVVEQLYQPPLSEYNYVEPVYQPEPVIEQPSYYETPAYIEEPEPEQPELSTFNNLSFPEMVEDFAVAAIPIPGYHKPTYEEEIITAAVAASSVIDDEVFDEITGIDDIYIEPINKHRKDIPDVSLQEQQTAPIVDTPNQLEDILIAQYGEVEDKEFITEETVSTYMPPVEVVTAPIEEYSTAEDDTEEAELLPANDEVDFEMVEPVNEPVRKPRPTPMANKVGVTTQPQFNAADDERVSMYNDEKMPYSFLWWLDKTRKEHADTYQPYVAFKPITQEVKRPAANDELQQQYFENIFHITSVEQLDMNTRDKRKEGEIIDRFIQQDPQLKPPNTEKLDNENKAKKSSEDHDEFVSETLARIYLDQMLYTKAISTYQKLLLKFPEKSSYFVAQIKLLEKKIN